MPPKSSPEKRAREIDVDASEPSSQTAAAQKATAKKPAAPKVQATLNFGQATGAKQPAAAAAGALNLRQYVTDSEWAAALAPLFNAPAFKKIEDGVAKHAAKEKVLPPLPMVFDALNACPLSRVKIVLVGQDPYPTPGHAHGLCFSVLPGVQVPMSLRNMYTELESDIPGFKRPNHGFLRAWAERGLLMLNATLTVNAGAANSHKDVGWQDFTDGIIKLINSQCTGVVFMLWGGFAQKKQKMIDEKKHRVVANAHPSPLSVKAWTGCKAFSRTNAALVELGKAPMDWSLPATAALREGA